MRRRRGRNETCGHLSRKERRKEGKTFIFENQRRKKDRRTHK
jgi:hypothetical protein